MLKKIAGKFTFIDERCNDIGLGPRLLLIKLFSDFVERAVINVVKFIDIVINDIAIKVKNKVSDNVRDLCSDVLS